jgi:site-specific DNA-methyltransferase (adenine-specific)
MRRFLVAKYELILGDCVQVMRAMPDKSVDLIFYDPPYNVRKKYSDYSDNLPEEEYREWMQDVACHAERISKKGVVVYVAGKLTKLFLNIFPSAHLVIVWKRAAGVCSGNYMLQYHSILSTAKPIVKCKDMWDDVRLPGEGYLFKEPRYENPGFTSLAMTEKVLRHFTEENDTVLDCFSGVGTTAVACVKNGRNFCGIELSQKYIGIAEKRIEEILRG